MTRGLPIFAALCILASLPLYGNWLGLVGLLGLVVIALTPARGRR